MALRSSTAWWSHLDSHSGCLHSFPSAPASEPGVNLFIADEASLAPVRSVTRVSDGFGLPLVDSNVRLDSL